MVPVRRTAVYTLCPAARGDVDASEAAS